MTNELLASRAYALAQAESEGVRNDVNRNIAMLRTGSDLRKRNLEMHARRWLERFIGQRECVA